MEAAVEELTVRLPRWAESAKFSCNLVDHMSRYAFKIFRIHTQHYYPSVKMEKAVAAMYPPSESPKFKTTLWGFFEKAK